MPNKDRPRVRGEDKQPIADQPVREVETEDPAIQNPTTDTGLVVEEQVKKEWDPKKSGGLPTFLQRRRRSGR